MYITWKIYPVDNIYVTGKIYQVNNIYVRGKIYPIWKNVYVRGNMSSITFGTLIVDITKQIKISNSGNVYFA